MKHHITCDTCFYINTQYIAYKTYVILIGNFTFLLIYQKSKRCNDLYSKMAFTKMQNVGYTDAHEHMEC
jgi:hypothetical protein